MQLRLSLNHEERSVLTLSKVARYGEHARIHDAFEVANLIAECPVDAATLADTIIRNGCNASTGRTDCTFRITAEAHDRLGALADACGCSKAAVVRALILLRGRALGAPSAVDTDREGLRRLEAFLKTHGLTADEAIRLLKRQLPERS